MNQCTAADNGRPVDETVRFLSALRNPGDVTELRALEVHWPADRPQPVRSRSGYFDADHLEDLARFAAELSDAGKARGVYVVLNPLKPECLTRAENTVPRTGGKAAKAADVAAASFLLVDVDPVKTEKNECATDDEKAEAAAVADHLRAALADRYGWHPATDVDTGNGRQLCFRVPPDTAPATRKRLLHTLAAEFDTAGAKIDTTTADVARMVRVPGTMNRKGTDTPDRPHRVAMMRFDSTAAKPLSADLLAVLVADDAHDDEKAAESVPPAVGKGFRVAAPTLTDRVRLYLAKCPGAVAGERGHAATFAIAATLVQDFGLTTADALPLLLEWNQKCAPPWSEPELRHKLTDAETKATPKHGMPRGWKAERGTAVRAGGATDCVIVIGNDEYRVNDEAAAAIGSESDLYHRGGMLVQVIEQQPDRDDDPAPPIRRPEGGTVVRPLPPPLLRERLTRSAQWVKIGGKDGDEAKPAHPPAWCVQAVHARGNWPAVRPLEAVLTHPVVLPGGRLLASSGYDRQSGLLVAIPPGLSLTVSDSPTRDDLAVAVSTLTELVTNFPFETDAHRAAWFAGLLTPLAWFAFNGPAPLFLIDANVRAAGKGLLADVIGVTLTGRRFATMSYTNDREELRKKITSLAAEGERLVLLDNLAGSVGNDVLDMALTTDRWKDRLLGVNMTYDGPLHVCWYGTGNNVQLQADTPRRVCHIRMESPEERPELRTDLKQPKLRSHVRKHRGLYLSAALTILRGWYVAGSPRHNLPSWGSYEEWSDVVRDAVVFAGLPDPGETRFALQTTADRDAEVMKAIIRGLEQLDPDRRGTTTAGVIEAVKDTGLNADGWRAELRGAVEELCGKLCGKTLGYRFRHFQRRNFDGRMLNKAGAENGSNRWVVVPIGPKNVPDAPHLPRAGGAASVSPGDQGHSGLVSGRGGFDRSQLPPD